MDYPRPDNFAELIWNLGFGREAHLWAMAQAWVNLFDLVKADLVICDHSPTALLAAHALRLPRVVIGSGFCVPPDVTPLPNLRTRTSPTAATEPAAEVVVLSNMNAVLSRLKQPPLTRVTQTYGDADETLLLTFEELDHYMGRQSMAYRGAWFRSQGQAPEWPRCHGPRVFAYLKPFQALPDLLRLLESLGHPTVVVTDGIPPKAIARHRQPHLWFAQHAVEIQAAARECDIAILHGGHGSTAAMLLAGRQVLLIPLYLEQAMLARAIRPLHVGLSASAKDGGEVERQFHAMLSSEEYARGAGKFAARYAGFEAASEQQRAVGRLNELLK